METPVHVLYVGSHAALENLSAPPDEPNIAFQVETVPRAAAAKERVAATEFDCIVVDCQLPDESGIAVLETVRQSQPPVPVFLLPTDHSSECIQAAADADVTGFLPCEPDQDRYPFLATRILDAVSIDAATKRAAKLERITTVMRDLNQALVHASTRAEIDRRVCEIISQSDPYLFAWIGDHDPESNTVTGRAAAGVEAGYLEQIEITTDETQTAQGPTGAAIRTRTVQAMQNIPEDPAYDPWRDAALERGYRSSASVPLVYDGTLYGVLNIYADRVGAFEANERELLAELGETIAYALDDVQVREELRHRQRAIEQAGDAIFITDIEGTIEYVNPMFETITGYTSAEVIGRTPHILQSGEHDDDYYARLWETILGGEAWNEEIINEMKSGKQYHAEQTITPITDEAGDIDGFIAIQRDITARKRRERDLERSRSRLRILFDHAPDGIVVHDIDGTVITVNETLAEMLGYAKDELRSMTIFDFERGIDEATLQDKWASMDAGSVHNVEIEGRHRRKDGSTYPVEVWVSRISTDEPTDRFLAFARDITDRKHRIRQLRVLDRVLRHNLHNEMAVIRGYAETIEDHVDGVDAAYARDIITSCDRLLETVTKEREIVQIVSRRPHRTEIDLVETIDRNVERLRSQYPNSRIVFDESAAVSVRATTNVERAIGELLENAIVHNDQSIPTVTVELTRNEGTVSVRIADTGPTIPTEEARILTGEEQIEPLEHGSGLGLWVAKTVADTHRGSLSFSETDDSTTVTLSVPRA